MKKKLFLLLIFPFFITCASLNFTQKPEAKIQKVSIDSISLKDVTFLFNIDIKNHYPLKIKLNKIALNVKIEGKQFLKTTTARGLNLRANGLTKSKFKLNLKYKDILRIIKSYSKKDYLNCTIDLDIIIPTPAFAQKIKKNITIHYTLIKKIPAIKPSLKIINFKIEKPNLKEISKSLKRNAIHNIKPKKVFGMFQKLIAGKRTRKIIDPKKIDIPITVSFDIELKNNTRAKLLFKKLQYTFYINNNKLIQGNTASIKTSGNKSIISIKNKFSSRVLGKSILKTLRQKKGKYSLKGEATLKLPDNISGKPLPMKFDEKGNFNFR